MSKNMHTEEYRGFTIEINARYIDFYYDWDEGYTSGVKFEYVIFKEDEILTKGDTTVGKPKPYRFLFKTFKPTHTLKELVIEEFEYLKKKTKNIIDDELREQEITDGLFDSLDDL